jgi:hypothetical protein
LAKREKLKQPGALGEEQGKTPRDLAIEDFFFNCEDNTHGRKYPMRKQRIVEHFGFVLTTVRKFPDAEELVCMSLLEGLGAVDAVRDIIVSVPNVLVRILFHD